LRLLLLERRFLGLSQRTYTKTRSSRKGFFFIIGALVCALVVLIIAVNLNLSSAGAGSTTASTLGLSSTSNLDTVSEDASGESFGVDEGSLLTSATNRNIDKAVDVMKAKEEAERKAAEEARLAAEAAKKAELEKLQARAKADAAAAGLSPVDWTMSQEDFINHWAPRIDAYMAGYPLAGQGRTFAEAAWNYGVDPRLSPAISNTESTRGKVCFLPHNAWGWGQSSWGSWEEAINAHVRGLKNGGYGPMITFSDAKRYCPPNADHWYSSTLYSMSLI